MNEIKVIKGVKCFLVKCPDCGSIHDVSNKNYYTQKKGVRNLSFRCKKCGQLRGAKTRRNPSLKIISHGYIKIYCPENPMSDKHGEVYEHRLILSKKLGRLLKKNEHGHHIDGNKSNNDPDNLELWDGSKHHSFHARSRVKKGHQGFIS